MPETLQRILFASEKTSNMDSVKVAKSAYDQGLITAQDYESVKSAFLRAQQIKAGFEAGFLKEDDYVQVKNAYLQSLQSLSGKSAEIESVMSDVARQLDSGAKLNGTAQAPARLFSNNSSAAPPSPVTAQPAPGSRVPFIPTNIPKMGGIKAKTGAQVGSCTSWYLHCCSHSVAWFFICFLLSADVHERDFCCGGCCELVLLPEGQVHGEKSYCVPSLYRGQFMLLQQREPTFLCVFAVSMGNLENKRCRQSGALSASSWALRAF